MEGPQKPFNTDNTLEIQRLELALESAGLGTWELDFDTNQIRWCHRAKRRRRRAHQETPHEAALFHSRSPH